MRRWFLDMDNTLVTGVHGSSFATRQWTEDGRAIWRTLLGLPVTLLSKVPDERLGVSYAQKRAWTDQECGVNVPLVVVPDSLGKHGFCIPGDVLVDDDLGNCEHWAKRGGVAVHHVTINTTLRELRALLPA